MNVYFLGSFFPIERVDEIQKNSVGAIANANDLWQWNIIQGLNLLKVPFVKYTFPQIGAFPKRYKKIYFKGSKACGSFLNLPIIKYFDRYIRAKNIIYKLLKNTQGESIIWIYDLHLPYILAMLSLKKKYPLKLCLFIPDLIGFTGAPNTLLYLWKEKIERLVLSKVINKVDFFVLLTYSMVKALSLDYKPYIVLEGMYNSSIEKSLEKSKKNSKTLFYSGAIDERNGVKNLIEAFDLLENDYKLVICGDGALKEWLIECSMKNPRIIFKGQLSHIEVVKLQYQSSLLINPRTSQGDFTQFSFPSKTLEYFASAVPVLMYKLAGIPSEYYKYCFTLNDNSVKSLAEKISYIHSLDENVLKQKGLQARNFILNNKTPQCQIAKVLEMIKYY